MRKSSVVMAFAVVAIFSLILLCTVSLMAEEEGLSIAKATEELTESIEDRPVSLLEYADTGMSLILRMTEQLWKTGKPLAAFKKGRERLGLEFSVFEASKWSLTAGKFFAENEDDENGIRFEEDWFVGVELKGIPFASHISEFLEDLRPQILMYQHKTWIGVSYKFRNEVE